MSEVALWYRRYHHMSYEICGSEEEAADRAVAMLDAETAAPEGIQFPDGRLVGVDNWPAYDEAEIRRMQADAAAVRAMRPVSPGRKIIAPFDGGEIEVDVDAPEWLGDRMPTMPA